MQSNSLTGRHALVTGAARGIGAEIARTLAAEGAVLTLLGRDREALQRVADSLAGSGHGVAAADVANPEAVQAAFAEARAARGPVAVLVNNAGAAESAPFLKTSFELWQRMLSVNLTGSFLCAQAALPDMLDAGWGRIVNIASTAGQKGYAYVAAYTAAKHGVIGVTRSLALEVARKGITVNAVCPGYTDTDILRNSVANVVGKTGRSEADALAEFSSVNPQKRIVQPAEVADAVRWLCGAGAASVTGQSISVSGGEVT
ncbi:SDR family oxidoreductase [Variovorax gossypii]|jgi:NAD(P)-dependent dehydrogenase (short-subunit alcohol dehydrogenase family)|uniref:SDR family oxidoreductase n=1 Tax=Variovorax gossypii TaxID=1679495 RepID=A0A431TNZ7_9BURK|nr:SDR family NAD(P)-dependent oxidoreductase [Variovorax gossypii]MDP9605644.1 NAD(P)-dependent dehydrogenase (short-subunit alcohol dehydrogenase family) [Variovorax paradoxus]RTQ35379.1 SDR family oxidoreductase [Variovorax gossypii]